MAKTGYKNGSDVLLYVQIGEENGTPTMRAIGHCTSHTLTYSAQTKDRTVKPVATAPLSSSLWNETTVTNLSLSLSAEGLVFYNEAACGYNKLIDLWKAAQPIRLKCAERNEEGNTEINPPTWYLDGMFVITDITETAPAGDDTTYSVSFKNSGEPTTLTGVSLT